MKIGVRLPYHGELAKPENMKAFARRADELGFHALFMSDHIAIPKTIRSTYPYNASGFDEPIEALELLTSLAFVASVTSRIRLMTGIMVTPYRNPLLAAKMIATLDRLSDGRMIVGLGAGWMEQEFEALGAEFEERGKVVEEYVKVFREIWSSDSPAFDGRFVTLEEGLTFQPKPVQLGGPPVWIGGESPGAIRRVARVGDGWIPIGSNPTYPIRTPAEMRTSLGLLDGELAKVGRSRGEVTVGYMVPRYRLTSSASSGVEGPFVGDGDTVRGSAEAFEEAGVNFLGFEVLGATLAETLDALEGLAATLFYNLT